jgi:hypothetical protein
MPPLEPTLMSSLLETLVAAEPEESSATQDNLGPVVVPDDSPYRIVLARLKRLVEYRTSMTLRLGTDPSAGAELNRVDGMIKEVHRAVSISPDARALAERIDAAG